MEAIQSDLWNGYEPRLASVPNEDPPFQYHSETSKLAADRIAPHAGSLEALVFELICASPDGLTDDGCLAIVEKMPGREFKDNSIRPRRVSLMHKGLVKKAGFKRPTRTGSPADVWVKA